MSKLTVDDLKKIHSKSDTPDHVKTFNENDGVEKYGGLHFDDPQFAKEAKKTEGGLYKTEPDFSNVKPATEKQIAFLKSLIAERCPDVDDDYTNKVIAQGRTRVSKAIDQLLNKPKAEVKKDDKPRTNEYAGRCEDCGGRVLPREGNLNKADNGKWEVTHTECPQTEFDFPFGRYAVDTDEGHLAFYVLNHRGLHVQASDDTHPLPANAIKAVADKIAADPQAASERYGQELGHCGRCGRTLTDEESRGRGTGPICATKGWT